jgi:hypothetical protein
MSWASELKHVPVVSRWYPSLNTVRLLDAREIFPNNSTGESSLHLLHACTCPTDLLSQRYAHGVLFRGTWHTLQCSEFDIVHPHCEWVDGRGVRRLGEEPVMLCAMLSDFVVEDMHFVNPETVEPEFVLLDSSCRELLMK